MGDMELATQYNACATAHGDEEGIPGTGSDGVREVARPRPGETDSAAIQGARLAHGTDWHEDSLCPIAVGGECLSQANANQPSKRLCGKTRVQATDGTGDPSCISEIGRRCVQVRRMISKKSNSTSCPGYRDCEPQSGEINGFGTVPNGGMQGSQGTDCSPNENAGCDRPHFHMAGQDGMNRIRMKALWRHYVTHTRIENQHFL